MRRREYLICYAKLEICTATIVILVIKWILNLTNITMSVSLSSVRFVPLHQQFTIYIYIDMVKGRDGGLEGVNSPF
jgi:hypothetical protein